MERDSINITCELIVLETIFGYTYVRQPFYDPIFLYKNDVSPIAVTFHKVLV